MVKINDIYTKRWKIEFNDCYSNGKVSYVTLSRYLQDTAGYHAEQGGFGMRDMMANNQSWVLTRFAMEVDELPKLNDVITIKSWISFVKGAFSNREYEVFVNDELFVRATSSWTVINFVKRQVENLMIDTKGISFDTSISMSKPAQRININIDFEKITDFEVKFSALDMLQHVSNLRYLDWTMDNVNHEKILDGKLKKITVNYMKELTLWDKVGIYVSTNDNQQVVKMNKNAGEICFVAKLEWK